MKSFKIPLWGLCVFAAFLLSACSQRARDKEIKADITIKAKEDVNFAGVHFTVDNGIVSLWGNCPTEKSRDFLLQKLSTIHVIKSVEDRIMIGPVSLGSDFNTKLQVDSVLASYPGVAAVLSGNGLRLIGKVGSAELPKMLEALSKINSGKVSIAELKSEI